MLLFFAIQTSGYPRPIPGTHTREMARLAGCPFANSIYAPRITVLRYVETSTKKGRPYLSLSYRALSLLIGFFLPLSLPLFIVSAVTLSGFMLSLRSNLTDQLSSLLAVIFRQLLFLSPPHNLDSHRNDLVGYRPLSSRARSYMLNGCSL